MSYKQYISYVRLNDPINEQSYLNALPVIQFLTENERLDFSKNIIFLSVKTVLENPLCLKLLQYHLDLILREEQKNFNFSTKNSHSELWKNIVFR